MLASAADRLPKRRRTSKLVHPQSTMARTAELVASAGPYRRERAFLMRHLIRLRCTSRFTVHDVRPDRKASPCLARRPGANAAANAVHELEGRHPDPGCVPNARRDADVAPAPVRILVRSENHGHAGRRRAGLKEVSTLKQGSDDLAHHAHACTPRRIMVQFPGDKR